MLVHIRSIKVMRWGTNFLLVSHPTRVPFGLENGGNYRRNLQDTIRSKRKMDKQPIILYFDPPCIKLMTFFMCMLYDIMLLMNLTKLIEGNNKSQTWNHYVCWTIEFDSLDTNWWTNLKSNGTNISQGLLCGRMQRLHVKSSFLPHVMHNFDIRNYL